jgi:hypothetical protein
MENVTDTYGWVKGNFLKEICRACDAALHARNDFFRRNYLEI